jgi:hexosaminidase
MLMRSVLISLLSVGYCNSAIAASDPADTYPDLHLIPWPKSLKQYSGYLQMTSGGRIVAKDERLKPLAEVLSEEIEKITGIRLKTTTGTERAGDIVLQINRTIKADEQILVLRNREPARTTDGAHTIEIGERITVEGYDYRSTAEGTSTILQLLGKTEQGVRFPRVSIKDWPHADFCGVMLDVARQDHPIAAIQKVVQICRFYKARYLQLHLTDDQGWTFPSTKFPKLGSRNYGAHGGIAPRVYKLDELKALVAFADARGVTIVPEMEVPGHSGAALRSVPEIFDAINPQSKQPVGMGCMNMSNEEIYPALDAIIDEMCDVFRSSPYFHIGSDEVTYGRLSLHPGYKAFMAKHGLKDDHQLADHFVASVCEIVKKHGKKAIKWEGLANTASKDVIIMAWDANSTVAGDMVARGYTTITCPWTLGVPWEQWNMYVCNGSRLKKGDSVLGATLVAWEQPPLTHITNLRKLAERQERTWGPDNAVTIEGFASRFQPLDAVVGKLIEMSPHLQNGAMIETVLGTSDFLDPAFAFDGNDSTYYKSAVPPRKDDHFTLNFQQPRSVYAIEVLTGINRKGQLSGGDVQVSADGTTFITVASLKEGAARAILKDNRVRSIRIRAVEDQTEQLIVRSINLQLLVEVSGVVRNPSMVIGSGNVAVTIGDTEFAYPIGACASPLINRNHTLKLNNGGNPYSFSGPISGSGNVEIYAAKKALLVIDGKTSNTMSGTWSIKSGDVVLAKEEGVEAMGGTIVVGGAADQVTLILGSNNQFNKASSLQLLGSAKGNSTFNLNGFSDAIARLSLATGAKIQTDGNGKSGVLTVREAIVEGKSLPRGIYTSSSGWVQGSGYVVVGDVNRVDVSGVIKDPIRTIGAGNAAILRSASTFDLPDGDCSVAAILGEYPLTLVPGGANVHFNGFVTGNGSLRIQAARKQPLNISGNSSNTYKGETTLVQGVLKLAKQTNAVAIPGNLTFGGSAVDNKDDAVVWEADGQIASTSIVTLQGTQPAYLDLSGHKTSFRNLLLSKAAQIRLGTEGSLKVKQLFVDGKRLKDGIYRAPQAWLEGTGSVTVDSRVDVQGVIGSPEAAIGHGNIGNLIGNAKIGYPSSGGDFDIVTNGFTLALDSGDGNAFAYSGTISGTGNVEFFMGPSYTGFRDAPMLLSGTKPNTATGKFLVRKGRVQLEKPEGVVAISGDVIVGEQGFNDCLFWKNSYQLKDTANITLLDAGNNGAAYLHLNGHDETAASLTMTVNNKILTDSLTGKSGTLIVRSLKVAGMAKLPGTYTAATEKWIEGKGKVIVHP